MATISLPNTETLPRRFAALCGAAALATVLFAVALALQVGGDVAITYISDGGTVLAPLIATLACIRAGKRHDDRPAFWWLLAAACAAWMLGEMIWAGYDIAGFDGPPSPSLADVGYLAFIPLGVAALQCHPGLHGGGIRKARLLIDALGIAIGLLFLSWTTVLGPMWHSSDLTTLAGVVTLAYPLGDVIIAFFVILALRQMGSADRVALWCLLVGLISLAIADSAYAYVEQLDGYSTGALLDAGWFAGFLAIALGAYASTPHRIPVQDDSYVPALSSLVAAFVPMLIALSAAAIAINLGYKMDNVAIAMIVGLIGLALIRQCLLVLDIVMLRGREHGANGFSTMTRAVLHRTRAEDADAAAPARGEVL